MFNFKKKARHEEVERQLAKHEEELSKMAERLRRLEIEAGIYRPELRRVEN